MRRRDVFMRHHILKLDLGSAESGPRCPRPTLSGLVGQAAGELVLPIFRKGEGVM